MLVPLPGFVLAGFGAGSGWSGEVHRDYYVVVATVIPVLLLALMLEVATVFAVGPILGLKRSAEDRAAEIEAYVGAPHAADAQHPLAAERRRLRREGEEIMSVFALYVGRMRWFVRGVFVGAFSGEVVSLYAIAADTSTAFTFVLSAFETVMLMGGLAIVFEQRFALD